MNGLVGGGDIQEGVSMNRFYMFCIDRDEQAYAALVELEASTPVLPPVEVKKRVVKERAK